MASFKQDVVDLREHPDHPGVFVGKSGEAKPGPREAKATCPKCGSPYIAVFDSDDSKYGDEIPGLTCTAGDCGFVGSARRAR